MKHRFPSWTQMPKRHWRRFYRCFGIAWLTLLTGLATAWGASKPWDEAEVVGDTAYIQRRDDSGWAIEAHRPATAGVVTAALAPPTGTDAVLIEARLSAATPGSVAFSAHEAGSGYPLGYWQNPLPLEQPTPVAAVLPLSHAVDSLRLFAGVHDQRAAASLSGLRVTFLRRSVHYPTLMYGAIVKPAEPVQQSLTASSDRIGAVVVHLRALGDQEGQTPDLIVRLVAFDGDVAASLNSPPVAQTRISARSIPTGQHGVDSDLAIPLHATVQRGKTYLIEFACAGDSLAAGDRARPVLLWCGPDGYADGRLYRNSQPTDWDLHLEIFEER